MDRLDVVHTKAIIATDSKPLFYQILALKVQTIIVICTHR